MCVPFFPTFLILKMLKGEKNDVGAYSFLEQPKCPCMFLFYGYS